MGRIRRWHQRHWRALSKAERVELQSVVTWHASIWVFPLSWLLLPMVGGLDRRPLPLTLGGLLVVVTVLQCAAAGRGLRHALDHYLGRRALPPRAMVPPAALLGLALALIVVLASVHGTDPVTTRLSIGAALMPFGLPYALAVPVHVFLRRSAALAVALVAALAVVRPLGPGLVATVVVIAFAAGFSLSAARCGAWTLSVLWEAERAREIEARLAVAEERLRFGRDLHDVLGRNLAVIALKAELAVQLAQRGRPEAVAQMTEVQRLAQESQREVRAVVRGYREADLGAELTGAQGVLAAAGIACTVTGSAAGLPASVQSALGWVVREAATNVLRHGAPRTCAVTLRVADGGAELTVENDGVPERCPGPEAGRGSGLAGLRERLAQLDGTLCAGPAGPGRFRLTAAVPLPPPADGAPPVPPPASAPLSEVTP
ncbi:sensor histidine kinase [Streptomyces tropicalis]|uniref:Histidine kinase n=1 Tax=Streptomyces tropicalis TaxID=3034234 RepID=A0ABT6AC94_9ACTN|nr:histidine kinase [Streptomyces tropicalis]MDF3302281.1 histidine kinase [Streptomyces tropicalis]